LSVFFRSETNEVLDDDEDEQSTTNSTKSDSEMGPTEPSEDATDTSTAAGTPTCPPPPPRPKQNRKRARQDDVSDRELLTAILNEDKRDDSRFFGKNIAETLRRFDRRQQTIAKARIQQILLEVEFASGPTAAENITCATVHSVQSYGNIALSDAQSDVWRLAGDDLAAAMYLAGIPQVPE